MYAMVCTRPDISFIVSKLSQYCKAPTVQNWVAAKHVLRYIKGTIDYGLLFSKCKELKLVGYSDSDWAGDTENRKSTSGYCFMLNPDGPLISWRSSKQSMVALSTCEAEYVALSLAVQENKYLVQLLGNMDPKENYVPVMIYEDNQGAIKLAENPIMHKRSKHIDTKYHYVGSEVENKNVKLCYLETNKMVADVLTKPTLGPTLSKFREKLFGEI